MAVCYPTEHLPLGTVLHSSDLIVIAWPKDLCLIFSEDDDLAEFSQIFQSG